MSTCNRRQFVQQAGTALGALAAGAVAAPAAVAAEPAPAASKGFQVGAYYFPNYHRDPRNERRYGPGWTEWDLVRAAKPRFAGHVQPKVPLWGCQDEADPRVMESKIAAAADHGVDYWIFDWYWYNDGPFIQRCLEEGYLRAANNPRVKFCLMWANHDWVNIFPAHRGKPHDLLYPGTVTRATFDTIVDHVVQRYFKHPSYWKVDGRPYFSIYELSKLLASFGGLAGTQAALDYFRQKTRAAGLPGLHLNAVVWGRPILPGEKTPLKPEKLVADLGFDSVTSYTWIHHVALPRQQTDYAEVQRGYFDYWDQIEPKLTMPYYPNVSMGWDPSPRTDAADEFGPWGYPFTNTMAGNTPQQFRRALEAVRDRLARRPPASRILNINAWNEWTEGSYLEPDTRHKLAYLEAIRDVFGAH